MLDIGGAPAGAGNDRKSPSFSNNYRLLRKYHPTIEVCFDGVEGFFGKKSWWIRGLPVSPADPSSIAPLNLHLEYSATKTGNRLEK